MNHRHSKRSEAAPAPVRRSGYYQDPIFARPENIATPLLQPRDSPPRRNANTIAAGAAAAAAAAAAIGVPNAYSRPWVPLSYMSRGRSNMRYPNIGYAYFDMNYRDRFPMRPNRAMQNPPYGPNNFHAPYLIPTFYPPLSFVYHPQPPYYATPLMQMSSRSFIPYEFDYAANQGTNNIPRCGVELFDYEVRGWGDMDDVFDYGFSMDSDAVAGGCAAAFDAVANDAVDDNNNASNVNNPNANTNQHAGANDNATTNQNASANQASNTTANEAHAGAGSRIATGVRPDDYIQRLSCSVCMEFTLNREPTTTMCGHVFCGPCIRQAAHYTHKCPLCNSVIHAYMLFRIYL